MTPIYSHPPSYNHPQGKDLLTHLRGVYAKCLRHMQHIPETGTTGYERKDYALAALYVCFWHDMGKLNPNFQKYLLDTSYRDAIVQFGYNCPPEFYKNHALVSAYGFLMWLSHEVANERVGELPMQRVISLVNVINRHHGDLRSRHVEADWRMFTKGEDAKLKGFLDIYPLTEIGQFYGQISELSVDSGFQVVSDADLLSFINPAHEDTVQHVRSADGAYYLPVLHHSTTVPSVCDNVQEFLFQQWVFSALCEADKRDASYNEVFTLADSLAGNQQQLISGLVGFSAHLTAHASASAGMKAKLNVVRSAMQVEAVESLLAADSGERIFSLTAPTGSGKTVMLLRLAEVLQRQHPELSVAYCLPFLSITDQVTAILENDIGLDVLTVTSLAEPAKKGKKKLSGLDLDEVSLTSEEKRDDERSHVTAWTSLTFDHPFIVTTFVQLFETLLSNRNARLLKLVNLKNRIFLIDEVQALPQNLYPFFVALLREFCYLHNCYAILSTATMPDFTLYSPRVQLSKLTAAVYDVRHVFPSYQLPRELLVPDVYFNDPVFNRYKLTFDRSIDNHNKLGDALSCSEESTLAICNTIAESRKTYEAMSLFPDEVNGRKARHFLLNTRFTPEHRREIIQLVRTEMAADSVVVLVSTSLVEAGVDLDFYKVYRDLCPWSNLIQAAGRDNRNYRYAYGEVVVLEMRVVDDADMSGEDAANVSEKSKPEQYIHSFIYADVYTKEVKEYLLANPVSYEKDLYPEQKQHFEKVCKNLSLGKYSYRTETNAPAQGNLLKELVELDVEKLGNFSLINTGDGKHEYTYFVPRFGSDDERLWQEWCDVWSVAVLENGRIDGKFRAQINALRRKIVQKCVTIRFKIDKNGEPTKRTPARRGDEVGGIYMLDDMADYDENLGLNFI